MKRTDVEIIVTQKEWTNGGTRDGLYTTVTVNGREVLNNFIPVTFWGGNPRRRNSYWVDRNDYPDMSTLLYECNRWWFILVEMTREGICFKNIDEFYGAINAEIGVKYVDDKGRIIFPTEI